jgi:hypothetical protein
LLSLYLEWQWVVFGCFLSKGGLICKHFEQQYIKKSIPINDNYCRYKLKKKEEKVASKHKNKLKAYYKCGK